jgi:hypothetical protein
MKKTNYLLSIIVMLVFSSNMISQDKIFLKSEENIETKILEINVDEVKYKKYSNQEGPTFTILKSDIHMIVYENGETEIFKEEVMTNNIVTNTSVIQENKSLNGGGAKIGLFVGLPTGDYSELTNFSLGLEFAYLGEVAENFEIGGLVGYLHYFGGESYYYGYAINLDDVGYVPVAFSTRYYFGDRKFFAGFDLGYAIAVVDYADGGFYYRPKFGFNFGTVNLIVSYSSISENHYKESSLNIGIEFNLN